MFDQHYPPLVLAYLVALAGWLAVNRFAPSIWPRRSEELLPRSWKEFGFAVMGVIGVIGMGQLWSAGIRLPEQGVAGPMLGAVNQVLIFSPILLVVVLRRQSWNTAWLPTGQIGPRLLVGMALACLAVTVYSLFRSEADAPWMVFSRVWRYEHFDKMVQVFLEDITIAILFVRLAGAIGTRWATVIVACLFAAGHVPVMISQGITIAGFGGLFLDAGIGVAVILVLQRSRDIVWFWCVHFCMDMTQFDTVNGVG